MFDTIVNNWEYDFTNYSKGGSSVFQGLSQGLERRCPKLAIVKLWGVQIFRGATIYSDFNHKHVDDYQNKAWYPYTMSWELYGDENIQLYAWDWYFKKFLSRKVLVSLGVLFISSLCVFGTVQFAPAFLSRSVCRILKKNIQWNPM